MGRARRGLFALLVVFSVGLYAPFGAVFAYICGALFIKQFKMSLKTYLSLAAAFLALLPLASSCVEDETEKVSFGVTVNGYILQGGQEGQRTFSPYIVVSSNNYKYKLQSVNIYSSNGVKLPVDSTEGSYQFETLLSSPACVFTDTARLNGDYTITATSQDGERAVTEIAIKVARKDTLDDVRPTELSYDGSNIKVKVPAQKAVKSYGIRLTPYNKGSLPLRSNSYYKVSQNTYVGTDSVATYSFPFYTSQLGADFAEVRVYFAGGSSLVAESDTTIIIVKQ